MAIWQLVLSLACGGLWEGGCWAGNVGRPTWAGSFIKCVGFISCLFASLLGVWAGLCVGTRPGYG